MSNILKSIFSVLVCILLDVLVGMLLDVNSNHSNLLNDFIYYYFLLLVYGSWVYILFVVVYHYTAKWLSTKTMNVLPFLILGFGLAVIIGLLVHLWLNILQGSLINGVAMFGITGIVYGGLYKKWIVSSDI